MNTDHLTPGAGPYKLTDAQVMLLWEEVFAKPGRSAIPTNILGFYLLIPQGDPTALSRAFNKVLETNDSLRLQLFRLDRRAARDNRTDYPRSLAIRVDWRYFSSVEKYGTIEGEPDPGVSAREKAS